MIAESREKALMDFNSAVGSAERKGRREGRQEGLQEGLQKGLQKGRQKGLQEGLQKGLQEGRQGGLQEGRLEVARNLLREKFPVETVAKGTGLSLEEVTQLASGLTG
jgi:predicted transposase/invertase (TIGR01784 family)